MCLFWFRADSGAVLSCALGGAISWGVDAERSVESVCLLIVHRKEVNGSETMRKYSSDSLNGEAGFEF
jgi:hypothetical protein